MEEASKSEVAKVLVQQTVDAIFGALKPVIEKTPATSAMAVVIALTLVRVAVRVMRQNNAPIAVFMNGFEAVMKKEFGKREVGVDLAREDSRSVNFVSLDGRPLIG